MKQYPHIKLFSCCLLLISAILLPACSPVPGGRSPVHIDHLRCEYLQNPLGIDVTAPRLSWEMNALQRGKKQTAYRVLVASDSNLLKQDKADIWDSRKVSSSQSAQVIYKGTALASRMRCYWKVKIWDGENRESAWSPVACWTMGLLHAGDWKAAWIGDQPDTITMPYPSYLHNGFHSAFDSSANDAKWVAIDLGSMKEMDEIRMYPTAPIGLKIKGYLFPVRFIISISGEADFKESSTLIDKSRQDVPNPGGNPVIFRFPPARARYVKIVVNKLARRSGKQYAFTLSQLEVLDKGNNLALHAPVTASDEIDQGEAGWKEDRLTDGITETTKLPVPQPSPPSPLLRKAFEAGGDIKNATLYVSALGLYEIRINGQKAGDHVLAPEWTDYRQRVQYQTYDVTSLVRKGSNVITAMLGDGWYIGPLFTHPTRGVYGMNRRLIAQLEIEKKDGRKEMIATDGSWKIDPDGPVRGASIYGGEKYDGRKAAPGWDRPGFKDNGWRNAATDTTIHIALSAQMDQPIRIIKELKPVRMFIPKPGVYIFDMGQNMVGWCRLRIPDYSGQQLVLRHGEALNDDHSLYTANLRGALEIDTFIAKPGHEIIFEPHFTYHGFRYVEVTGLHQKPGLSMVSGEVFNTSASQSGTFSCSDPSLNQLWKNILWTQRGNTMGVPTDCPQRDERMGWMGDAQVFSQTAVFNMNMSAFYTKWMRDIRDGQLPDGRIGDFSPQLNTAMAFYNAPGWADAAVFIPWRMYVNYGDTRILEQQYDVLTKFNAYIKRKNPGYLWKEGAGYDYSDWLNGDAIIAKDYPKTGGAVPPELYSTAFFARSTALLAKMAGILGKEREAKYYTALAGSIKNAFNENFVSADGALKGSTQAGYALALHFNLLPDSLRPAAARLMVAALSRYDNRMSTGIQSTIRLMEELTRWGYNDLAYRLLESRRFPSWLYSIDQGATTVWERWDGYVKGRGFQNPGMNSLNHYAFGSIGQWMYHHIIGIIPDDSMPGYDHFIIYPRPGGGLRWAKGTYHSIHGMIESSWQSAADHFTLQIKVPVNTTATVFVPLLKNNKIRESERDAFAASGVKFLRREDHCAVYLVQSGKYIFQSL